MREPRQIGDIIAEIMGDLAELRDRYERDCGDEVISCKAAARYIGRSPCTISRYIAEGKLEKVCTPGNVGIRKAALNQLK